LQRKRKILLKNEKCKIQNANFQKDNLSFLNFDIPLKGNRTMVSIVGASGRTPIDRASAARPYNARRANPKVGATRRVAPTFRNDSPR
jgi:tmRNA-binding protein